MYLNDDAYVAAKARSIAEYGLDGPGLRETQEGLILALDLWDTTDHLEIISEMVGPAMLAAIELLEMAMTGPDEL